MLSTSLSARPIVAALCVSFGLAPLGRHEVATQAIPRTVGLGTVDSLPRLIPIEALFEAPAVQWGGISPDGRWLSTMKPWHGHQNVFVRRVGSNVERAVTRDSVRSIPNYWWSADGSRILWIQDKAGDENYHLYVASIRDTSAKALDLTPFKNVEVEVLSLPVATPGTAIITMNNRNPELADAYRVDLATGARRHEPRHISRLRR